MSGKRTILVVIDLRKDHQPAFEYALDIGREFKGTDTHIEVLLSANPANSSFFGKRKDISIDGMYIQELHNRLEKSGLSHSIQICWTQKWSDSVLSYIQKDHVFLVLLSQYGNGNQSGNELSDERWRILRLAECSVILVQPKKNTSKHRLLATIKIQDHKYDEYNKNVIAQAQKIAESYGMELHVVNAYSDSMHFPDRVTIAKMAKIPNERIHISSGTPENVISATAKKIDAESVLIANQNHKRLKGRQHGYTTGKIINKLECNIVMI